MRQRVRSLHYSLRAGGACVRWCRAFVRFHGLLHPSQMCGPEVEAFLTHLAALRGLSVSSHRQSLPALLFLYGKVLGRHLPWMDALGRPVPMHRLPVVLSADEVAAVLQGLDGVHGLLARLLYGTGLRVEGALQLRVKDLEFANQVIVVHSGKGGNDRVVVLPRSLAPALRLHLAQQARALWSADRAAGCTGVQLPDGLDRKHPRAGQSWGCSRSSGCRSICAAACCAAIICTPRRFAMPSSTRCTPPSSPSRPRRTRCATASSRTCCSRVPTSAPSWNCSAMPTCR